MLICRGFSARQLVMIVVVTSLLHGVPCRLQGEEVADFFNVVASKGADPWLWQQDGQYYATLTTGSDIVLIRSRYLSTLGAGDRKVVWKPTGETPVAKNLWAPEIHRFGGAWYLYVAADDGKNANHRMYVLENKSADPFVGDFHFKARVSDPHDDRWAIDGTPFQVGDHLYFVWSGWEGNEDVRQSLYLAPMSNPWTLSGPRVEISRPTLPWEVQGGPPTVNEGPQVLIKRGLIHLIYSASGSWTDSYCLGRLTAELKSDLLAPSSWKKHDRPVFATANGIYGPGHCSFVKSPDGAEDWIVYHAACYQGAGWRRLVRVQPFGWDADDRPHFGEPVAPDRTIPIPGGEPVRLRIEAETAELISDARLERRSDASRGAVVRLSDQGKSSLALVADVDDGGAYVLSIRFRQEGKGDDLANQTLTINGGPTQLVSFRATGPKGWSNNLVSVQLIAGRNRIRLDSSHGAVELDSVDLVPTGRGTSREPVR